MGQELCKAIASFVLDLANLEWSTSEATNAETKMEDVGVNFGTAGGEGGGVREGLHLLPFWRGRCDEQSKEPKWECSLLKVERVEVQKMLQK